MYKQIKVFDREYEKLLMRAGSDDKIAYVVKNITDIIEAISRYFGDPPKFSTTASQQETRHEA